MLCKSSFNLQRGLTDGPGRQGGGKCLDGSQSVRLDGNVAIGWQNSHSSQLLLMMLIIITHARSCDPEVMNN